MRISTRQMVDSGIDAILRRQAALERTQLQLSTGRRLLTPADDPAASARALDLSQAIATTKQYQGNNDAARARLQLEEGTLGSAQDLLQRVRELVVLGNNDSQNTVTRVHIAEEIAQRLDELLGLANTRDANQEYIFAGTLTTTKPFADTGAAFSYAGDAGVRSLQVAPGVQVALGDSGLDSFMNIRDGNGSFATAANPANSGTGVIDPGSVSGPFVPDTYTLAFTQALPTDPITYTVTGLVSGVVAGGAYQPGADIVFNGVKSNVSGIPAHGDSFTVSRSRPRDVFTTLDNIVTALRRQSDTDTGRAQLHNALNRELTNLDQAMVHVDTIRARAGSRLNALESEKDAMSHAQLRFESTRSEVEDLDYAEATARMNRELLAIQAAQQAYIKVQGLTLFDYLR